MAGIQLDSLPKMSADTAKRNPNIRVLPDNPASKGTKSYAGAGGGSGGVKSVADNGPTHRHTRSFAPEARRGGAGEKSVTPGGRDHPVRAIAKQGRSVQGRAAAASGTVQTHVGSRVRGPSVGSGGTQVAANGTTVTVALAGVVVLVLYSRGVPQKLWKIATTTTGHDSAFPANAPIVGKVDSGPSPSAPGTSSGSYGGPATGYGPGTYNSGGGTNPSLGSPVQGSFPVTQTYGNNYPGEPLHNGVPFHEGIDLGTPVGTPVYAPASGKIAVAGSFGGFGTGIKELFGAGMDVILGHLSSVVVGVGDMVQQGQLLGYSGSTGYSSGPHLHVQYDRNGVAIDPRTLGYAP